MMTMRVIKISKKPLSWAFLFAMIVSCCIMASATVDRSQNPITAFDDLKNNNKFVISRSVEVSMDKQLLCFTENRSGSLDEKFSVLNEEWNITFGGDAADSSASVEQTNDGGFIIAGQTCSYGSAANNVWLLKTDSSGKELWNNTFSDGVSQVGDSVQQTSDGGYVIAGMIEHLDTDAWLIKANSTGAKLWDKEFGGSSGDSFKSIQLTSEGGYVVTGRTYNYNAGGHNAWLIKTDSNGQRTGSKAFIGSQSDSGNSVQQTSDEGYIIAGETSSYGAGGNDAWLIKTDSNCNEIWNETFGGPSQDYGRSVKQTSDGGYIIAGETSSYGAGSVDAWLIKTDSAGNELWNETFGGASADYGRSVLETNDGGYIIAGYTYSYGAGNCDAWLVRTDSNGNELWNETIGGLSDDRGVCIQQTSDGGYIISGYTKSYGAGGNDAWLIKVRPESGSIPDISLIKMTNGEDANSPPGPSIPVGGKVTWTYEVTNTGNVDLTNIQVTDGILGPIGTIPLLSPGQTQVLTATGMASAGQYSNLGGATGTTPSGSEVSDEDLSHYYGESANPISIDIDETASEEWIDPYSSNTDDKEARIWYEIAPDDFSGQLEIEIKDKNGESWNIGPTNVAGGRRSLTWDGRIANEYVNQANNPYYITLVLEKDEKEVARSASQRIWVGRPVILLHGIFSSKEEIEKTDLYDELSSSFYTRSIEYDGGIIGSSTGDIKQYAGKLSNEVDSLKQDTCAKKIDIVAHSMGGLVARYYVQMSEMGETDVGKLIMIGTPNHGADFASLPKATLKALINLILDELGLSSLGYSIDFIVDQVTSNYAINEMIPHHTFIKNLNGNDCCAYNIMNDEECSDKISAACQYTVITSEPTWVPTLTHMHSKINIFGYDPLNVFWVTAGDGVVPFFSAELSDVSISSEGTSFHPNQANSQNIITKVKTILQQPNQLAQYDHALFDEKELDANSTPAYWTNPIEDVIYPGDERSYNILVDQSSIQAHFMLVWDDGALNVTLSAPNGTEIEMPSKGNVAYYSVQNPDPGNWTAEILPTSIPANGTNVTVQAFIENPLFIGVVTDKSIFDPQEPFNITAYVGDNQSGFSDAFVIANVSIPDNSTETLFLYDDGLHNDNETADGVYANQYMNTSLWGTYRISISASGNKDGNYFERQMITTVWVELYPDLTLNASDIYFSNSTPVARENITLTAEIHNIGDADAENSSIRFYDNDPASGILIGEDVINVSKGSFEKAEAFWNATPGQHEIYVCISPYNSFFELNYSNNVANKSINVSIANNSCISGTKFNDTNSNATRDPGEAGLSGWTIRLTRPDGTTINTTTDASGGYKFENLTSGTYRVSEVRQDNWTQTYPAWLGDHIINVTDGNVTGVDFGNNYLPVPEIPYLPSGPASGIPGAQYSYSTSSTDPSGYQISYTFDWGDGTNSTTSLFDSGATASAAHIWNSSGVYQVRAMATNSKGASSGWSGPLNVTINAPPSIPTVTNGIGSSLVTANSARLNGEIADTGGENPTVHICWGTSDGATTLASWQNDAPLGVLGTGAFYKDVTGLTPGTQYYYRCYATNSAGTGWASSTANFTTQAVFNEPVYRMYSPSQTDHFYTTNYYEYSTIAPAVGYIGEGILGNMYSSSQTGTVPVYRMYSPSQTDHFYTTNYYEYSTIAPAVGYIGEGILGNMYSSSQTGTVPVYRMYSPSQTDHFYTTNYYEYSTIAPAVGYIGEGILGYMIQPVGFAGGDDLPQMPANATAMELNNVSVEVT